jgi:hypothetical protein
VAEKITGHHGLRLKTGSVVIIGAVLGFGGVVVPAYLKHGGSIVFYDAPLFPIIATARKNLVVLPTTALLLVSGSLVGYLRPRLWWLLGATNIVIFPIAAVAELILYPRSHNLWPIELLLYALLSIPSIVGAWVGAKFKRRRMSRDS